MDRPLAALVLAGGTGTRLYPASRPDRPKQFLALGGGDRSLLERTVDRVDFADEVFVVTRPELEDGVRERAPGATVLVEPDGKDTGPALVYATHRVREAVDDPVVLALPSDHVVSGDFAAAARRGARVAAETGSLVTFGVEPTRPATGYGYLEPGADRGDHAAVAAFHEKPDAATAARYVEEGYRWNAGIFAWTPASLLSAARDSPLEPLVEAIEWGDPAAGFDAVDPVSVDRAVFERAADVVVVPVDFAWDDLGSWDALERLLDADAGGNVVVGEATALDASDNVVVAPDDHVSLVGVSDLVVVAWGGRVLVVPTDEAQRVRDLVARLDG